MQDTLTWLLDLQTIRLDELDRISLQFMNPLDGWMWFLLATASTLVIAMIYRRDGGPTRARIAMALCRISVVILVLILINQPAVVYRQDRTEPSTVAVMIDDSASMLREDYYSGNQADMVRTLVGSHAPQHGGISRWTLASAVLSHENLATGLLDNHHVRLFRFAGSASAGTFIESPAAAVDAASQMRAEPPKALSTHLAASIEQVFEACSDAHLAGIVILTDGQPTQTESWDTVEQLAQTREAPIHIVLTGDPTAPVDAMLEDVQIAKHVYVGDKASCRATIHTTGLEAKQDVTVQLRGSTSDDVLVTRTLTIGPDAPTQTVELQFDPTTAGDLQLVAEVVALDNERELNNNVRQLRLTVVEDDARVLYVEGYPRYDFRYLKNTLLREPTVTVSTLLLSADEEFVQDGDIRIRRFPATAEELNQYDVVLLGDIDPQNGWLSHRQLELIAEFVSRHGGGLGILAGERHSPQRFYGTPLETLVPVVLSGSVDEQLVHTGNLPFKPRLTAAGRESPILRLLLDETQSSTIIERMPHWFWASPVRGVRPGAEVLLEHPNLVHGERHLPIAVVRRYGAGTVFFQGSDDTWRWRRYRGETFFDTYWLQAVRHLAQNKKFPTPRGLTLRTDRKSVLPDEPLSVVLSFDDPATTARLPDALEIEIQELDSSIRYSLPLKRPTPTSQRFESTFVPSGIGRHGARFDPQRYALDLPEVAVSFEVETGLQENRRPEANLALMTDLARVTGGDVVDATQAATLIERIPTKKVVVPNDIIESVWDSRVVLALFTILVAIEWVLRKRHGLA